jgi:long-subunit acyl-CoA synthetase (AMP-forming)
MFLKSTQKFAAKTASQSKRPGRWVSITYGEFRAETELVAGGLAALGLKPLLNKPAIWINQCITQP